MNLELDWPQIRHICMQARRSALHQAIATVNEDGTPQVTPIGSLWLDPLEPRGMYVDLFNRALARNVDRGERVSVLAVDARYRVWFAALAKGKFDQAPAIRLSGRVGPRRRATEDEAAKIRTLFRKARFLRGYKLLWSRLDWIRDVEFDTVIPVRVGAMTKHLYH